MQITAAMVKELRERTGAGMMDCKKALAEAAGDIEMAIENMRKSGVAKAAKKAGRTAAEGVIAVKQAANNDIVMLEINCETDFVAKDENFLSFVNAVADTALANKSNDAESVLSLPLAGTRDQMVEDARLQLVSKIGENISVRRAVCITGGNNLGVYLHGNRIGVVVEMMGGDVDLAKDIAMHVAASRPVCVREDEVAPELLQKEKEIYTAQAAESGKPAAIVEKMVLGRLAKYLKEITLLGQPFVKDPDQTVGKLLNSREANVVRFIRYEVGEGIEKKLDNFAEEVRAQAGL